MNLKQKLTDAYYKLRGIDPPVIQEIPDFNKDAKYEREQWFYMLYLIAFFVLFIVWVQYSDPLLDWFLTLFPSVGPVPGFWIVNSVMLAGLGLAALGIHLLKEAYLKRVAARVNLHPVMTGTITEMTETGWQTKEYQFPVQDVRHLAKPGQSVELWGNPGNYEIRPDDHVYLATQAYTTESDLMHQVVVITNHPWDDHMTLTRTEDVFLGYLGIPKKVSKVDWVVPTRIQDQRPVMYVAKSGVTVEHILNRQPLKQADMEEMYAAERLTALTRGERLLAQSVQDRAVIKELTQENVDLKRQLLAKENREEEKSVILTPETDKLPFFGGYLTGWKMYLVIAIIIFTVMGLLFLGGSYLGFW